MTHTSKRPRKAVRHIAPGHKKHARKLRKIARGKVISQRGRAHPMAAPSPGMPQQPQDVFMASTVISSFRYKGRRQILRIYFQSGHVYDYFDVPAYTVQLLTDAPSKGRYFYYNIRTSFRFRRVR